MRYKHKNKEPLFRYFFCLFSLIALVFIFATSNKKNIIVASNINTVKAIESSRIKVIEKEEKKEEEVESKYKTVYSVNEIETNQDKLIEFTGTITGYGPDCPGCSGVLACSPHQNVLNNNIYYNDNLYGTIRILAADPSIPCGSIIKVSNYDNQEFIGIVLDRGRDIHGLTMDLLFESENSVINLGRKYNINFKVERWGY
ncbi:MAG: 3D domain-containing protein [Bacilli bacterium]|nr:3D domain-containing protein [Bacilli bacterium]